MKRVDCDVFMKDGSTLDLNDKMICITGNFYGGYNCCVTTAIIAGEDVIFEDCANTDCICAVGNVSVGKFSHIQSVSSNKNIFLGDYTTANDLFAEKDVALGYKASVCSITTNGSILISNHCDLKTFFKKCLKDIKHLLFGE